MNSEWGFKSSGDFFFKDAWKHKGDKYKLETIQKKNLAVREGKLLSKIPQKVLAFQPLNVLT